MRKLSLIFSSHFSDEENQKFIDHLKQTTGIEIHVECIKNHNQYSLTEAYNIGWKKLDELERGKDIIVFCHNDIIIKTKDWGKIIVNLFKTFGGKFDILGIAGTTELSAHGCWWLKPDGKEMNFPKMFGRVWHTNGIREWESIYSEKIPSIIKEVVLVDGLFFAVNGETIAKRFNEEFKNFHFYDLSFCIENYLEGCNIGVIDRISVLHKSVGQTNQNWENNREQFANQFKDELPISI
jgi:hypothetical protein